MMNHKISDLSILIVLLDIFLQVHLALLIAVMKLYGRKECEQVKIFLFINSHSFQYRKYNKPVLSKHTVSL